MGLEQLDIHLGKTSLAFDLIIYSETVVPSICEGHLQDPQWKPETKDTPNLTYTMLFFLYMHTYLR